MTAPPPDDRGRSRSTVAGGISYAVASAVANGLGYLLALGAARLLTEDEFGALGAVLALAIIGYVPGMALQVVHGRWTATGTGPALGRHRGAVLTGAALLVVCSAAAVPLDGWLDLGGPATLLLLGLALAPGAVAASLQGDLLGRQRYHALSGLLVLYAALRVAGGLAGAALGWGTPGVMAGVAAAAWVVLAAAAAIAGPLDLRWGSPLPLREYTAAVAGIAGLLVLANVDVVLARRVLDPADSGAYALGSLFSKAAFWAPQFLSLLVVPRLARAETRARTLRLSFLAVAGLGLAVVLLAWAFGPELVQLTSGGGYLAAGESAGLFAAYGALLALLQLVLYAGISRKGHRVQGVPWLGVAGLVIGVSLLPEATVATVATLAAAAAAGCVAVAVVVERVSWRHPAGLLVD
jgi:hypothetical protein